jgi:hypothetical protein
MPGVCGANFRLDNRLTSYRDCRLGRRLHGLLNRPFHYVCQECQNYQLQSSVRLQLDRQDWKLEQYKSPPKPCTSLFQCSRHIYTSLSSVCFQRFKYPNCTYKFYRKFGQLCYLKLGHLCYHMRRRSSTRAYPGWDYRGMHSVVHRKTWRHLPKDFVHVQHSY